MAVSFETDGAIGYVWGKLLEPAIQPVGSDTLDPARPPESTANR